MSSLLKTIIKKHELKIIALPCYGIMRAFPISASGRMAAPIYTVRGMTL
jgi:hypothetical protein